MSENTPQQPERPQMMTRKQLRELRAAQAAQGQPEAHPAESAPSATSQASAAEPQRFSSRRQMREGRTHTAGSASAQSAHSVASAASAPGSAPQAPEVSAGQPPRVAIPRSATGTRSVDPQTGALGQVESTGNLPRVSATSAAEAPEAVSPQRPSVSEILERAARQEAERSGQVISAQEPASPVTPPMTRHSARSAASAASAPSAPSAFSAASVQSAYSAASAPEVLDDQDAMPQWASIGTQAVPTEAPDISPLVDDAAEEEEVWPVQVPFPHPDEAPQASFEEILAADDEETDELDHRFDWKHWLMLMVAAAVIGVLVWLLVDGVNNTENDAFGMTQYVEAAITGSPAQGELW